MSSRARRRPFGRHVPLQLSVESAVIFPEKGSTAIGPTCRSAIVVQRPLYGALGRDVVP